MKVAISQVQAVECPEDEENIQRLDTILETIANASDEADIICFPEYFLGKSPPEPMPNGALLTIQEAARLAGVNVVCGVTRELRHGNGSYLTSIVVDRAGHVVASLDKTSLYPAEQVWYRAGRGELLVEIDGGIGVGVLAGYDWLRADLVRDVMQAGAQLLIAQFAADNEAYLETMRAVVTARALEYLVPVVAVGQLGEFFGRSYIGGSTVVQPTMADGNLPGPVERVLAMGDEEAMWVVDLNLDAFREMRRRFSYAGPPRIPRR